MVSYGNQWQLLALDTFWVKTYESKDVAVGRHLLSRVEPLKVELLLDGGGEAVPVGVHELDVERLEEAEHAESDTTSGNGSDGHALQVVAAHDGIGDVPSAVDDDVVRGDEVADEGEDLHDNVLAKRGGLGDRGQFGTRDQRCK